MGFLFGPFAIPFVFFAKRIEGGDPEQLFDIKGKRAIFINCGVI